MGRSCYATGFLSVRVRVSVCVSFLVHACVYVCGCEHADEADEEPAPQWVGRWGGGGVWIVCFTQTNTPFVVSLACVTSPAGDSVHLAQLVLEPNVFLASVVK